MLYHGQTIRRIVGNTVAAGSGEDSDVDAFLEDLFSSRFANKHLDAMKVCSRIQGRAWLLRMLCMHTCLARNDNNNNNSNNDDDNDYYSYNDNNYNYSNYNYSNYNYNDELQDLST